MDYLGLGSKYWPVDLTIKLTPKGWAIGCFDTTFGDAEKALRKHLKSGKFPAARVHIWYSSAHDLCPLELLKTRAPIYEKIARDFPNVKIYLSHSCEYKTNDANGVAQRISLIQKLAPSCVPVNCIWQGPGVAGIMEETHDVKAKKKAPYLTSTDGVPNYDIDNNAWLKRHDKAEIRFLWGYRFNLKGDDKEGTAPKDRKGIPDERYIRAMIRLGSEEGSPPAPKFKGQIIPVEKPILWKSFAEDGEGQDIRSNKPCFIVPSVSRKLIAVDCFGKAVAALAYFGPYQGNLSRYYSGTGNNLYGYEIGNKARKQSGFEFVWLQDNKKFFYGPINPAFRCGYFR